MSNPVWFALFLCCLIGHVTGHCGDGVLEEGEDCEPVGGANALCSHDCRHRIEMEAEIQCTAPNTCNLVLSIYTGAPSNTTAENILDMTAVVDKYVAGGAPQNVWYLLEDNMAGNAWTATVPNIEEGSYYYYVYSLTTNGNGVSVKYKIRTDGASFCGNGRLEPGEDCDSTSQFCASDCHHRPVIMPSVVHSSDGDSLRFDVQAGRPSAQFRENIMELTVHVWRYDSNDQLSFVWQESSSPLDALALVPGNTWSATMPNLTPGRYRYYFYCRSALGSYDVSSYDFSWSGHETAVDICGDGLPGAAEDCDLGAGNSRYAFCSPYCHHQFEVMLTSYGSKDGVYIDVRTGTPSSQVKENVISMNLAVRDAYGFTHELLWLKKYTDHGSPLSNNYMWGGKVATGSGFFYLQLLWVTSATVEQAMFLFCVNHDGSGLGYWPEGEYKLTQNIHEWQNDGRSTSLSAASPANAVHGVTGLPADIRAARTPTQPTEELQWHSGLRAVLSGADGVVEGAELLIRSSLLNATFAATANANGTLEVALDMHAGNATEEFALQVFPPTSVASCGSLGWPVYEDTGVCFEHSDTAPLPAEELPYAEAVAYCRGLGARICTAEEIIADPLLAGALARPGLSHWVKDGGNCSAEERRVLVPHSESDVQSACAPPAARAHCVCCADPAGSTTELESAADPAFAVDSTHGGAVVAPALGDPLGAEGATLAVQEDATLALHIVALQEQPTAPASN